MTTISTLDLPAHLPGLFDRLAAGEVFLVTDHDRPVARILPPEPAPVTESAADWVERWYAWTNHNPKRELALDVSREAMYDGCGE